MRNHIKNIAAVFLVLAILLSGCAAEAHPPREETVSPSPTEFAPPPEEALFSPAPSSEPLPPSPTQPQRPTLEDKVWQMMYITPQDLTGEKCSTDKELWAKALEEKPVGGIVFLSDNIPSVEGIKGMMYAIYAADAGVFLGLDEEGGEVARLAYALGVTTKFKPMYEYQLKGTGVAYQNAYTIGSDISSFGFNMNFAPVADVWNNYWNTVIGYRSYATDSKRCAELVAAAVEGYHSAGVISVLKHFPGHGNTFEDSHYDAAYTKKSIEEMRKCEFRPFVSGIESGSQVVMLGHIIATEIDPVYPATLSSTIIQDVLRGELGFEGLVITDAFTMAGLGDMSEAEAAVMAVEAGCDMILAPGDPEAAVKAIVENVSEERIEESYQRILQLKHSWGLIE
ncbi:MAG: glycoside hydrolase family 3 protein [Oscillospiraceae bacterium]|nr:glycoside hydrolase family 3 protein [Oscillospiraceae bacterium]